MLCTRASARRGYLRARHAICHAPHYDGAISKLGSDSMRSLLSLTVATLALAPATAFAQAQLPAGVAAPGETVILTVHAEGAQVYDCKAGADGRLVWTFREPIAMLPA
jgi:hypothetical protein